MLTLVFTKFGSQMNLASREKDLLFFPDRIAQRKMAETRSKDTVEFINVWRTGVKYAWDRQRTSVAQTGVTVRPPGSGNAGPLMNFKAVPVDLNYSFWVWTRELDRLQTVTDRFMFWPQRNPTMQLIIPQVADPIPTKITPGAVTDVSPVEQQYEMGVYFVYRFDLAVAGWLFEIDGSIPGIAEILVSIYEAGRNQADWSQGAVLLSSLKIT